MTCTVNYFPINHALDPASLIQDEIFHAKQQPHICQEVRNAKEVNCESK